MRIKVLPATKLTSKSGNALETRLTFIKIKVSTDQPSPQTQGRQANNFLSPALTCFNNFSKTDSEKMKKYIIETEIILLKIYAINFPICIIKFQLNFKYRSSHQWCSLNKIFLKSPQYLQKNIHAEAFFNKFIGLKACNFTKKRIQYRRFPVNTANFKNTYFEKHLRTAGSENSYILH